ncbi:MAG: hypothetical protein RLN70_00150, partial [Rhodospirillaceae bacterium]
MAHESILIYRNYRYLKWAVLLVVVSSALYVFHAPIGQPNGGTWLGYTLGGLSAGLMVWLAWFGVRKRRYTSGGGRLEDWLSAHVYLGLALLLIATLHSGFQFGWNIHTVLYFLMVSVAASGAVGLYFYIRFPKLLSQNRRGLAAETMLSQIADLDRDIRALAMTLDEGINNVVYESVVNTQVGQGFWRQISGTEPDCPTSAARYFVEQHRGQGSSTARRDLLARLVKK